MENFERGYYTCPIAIYLKRDVYLICYNISTMRLLLMLSLICLIHFQANAQKTFAPDGAQWYFGMQYGSFHDYVDGDTVIQGVQAQIIKRVALTSQPHFGYGLRIYNLEDMYIHDGVDTVWAFNHQFSRFTPLFIFNLQEGDTTYIPLLSDFPNDGSNPTDTTFCLVIDSIRTLKYDTAYLRTFFTRSLHSIEEKDHIYNWGDPEGVGAYAEKIGGIFEGFSPWCFGCPVVASELYQGEGSIRCYSDSGYTISMVNNECDNGGIPSAIGDVTAADAGPAIFPNPAGEFIHIKMTGPVKISRSELVDALGRQVRKVDDYSTIPVSINTTDLPGGIYLLRIWMNNQTTHTHTVFIQHD